MSYGCTVHFDEQQLDAITLSENAEAMLMLNENLALRSNYRARLLHQAIALDNDDIARYLINMASPIEFRGPEAKTPLMMAVERDRKEIVKVLLEAGADIDAVDADGKSALHKALYSTNDYKIVEAILLRAKAETQDIHKLIEKLLAAGCLFPYFVLLRDVGVLEDLLQRGFEVNSRARSKKRTALHFAAMINDSKSAELLVARGADVNAADLCSAGPLFYAVEAADSAMMRLLLDHGADPDPNVRYFSQMPLFVCFIVRDSNDEQVRECAELLLERGAYPWRPSTLVQLIQLRDHEIFRNSRLNGLVAHQAMLDVSGVPSCEEGEHLTKFVELREYYDKCREILEVEVVGGMTVFRVLDVGSDRELRRRARDQAFVRQIEEFCAEPKFEGTFSYYARILKNRVAKAARAVKLEKRGMIVICDLFKCDDNQLSIFARQVVGYLSKSDLEQLSRVSIFKD